MKMGDAHIVPLLRRAVEILRKLQRSTWTGKHVFPSLLFRDRAISENTINVALRRLGYSGPDGAWVPENGDHAAQRAGVSAGRH